MKKELFVMIIILLMLTQVFTVRAIQPKLNKFTELHIKNIYAHVNNYNDEIYKYSSKFGVPVNLIKAIMGVESNGVLNSLSSNYNDAGAIGLMQIVPFYDPSGNNLNHQSCLNECMTLDVQPTWDLAKKRQTVKSEYQTPEKSICCGTYLLKQRYGTTPVKYLSHVSNNPSKAKCDIYRYPQPTYTEWELAARKYNGLGCSPDSDHAFYVERVMQLWNAFDQMEQQNSVSHGSLKFTPAFSLKLPPLINVYNELDNFVEEVVNDCSKSPYKGKTSQIACLNSEISNFESTNNVELLNYCEEPAINVVNSISSNIINALNFGQENCLYEIISSYSAPMGMNNEVILNFELINNTFFIDNDRTDSGYIKQGFEVNSNILTDVFSSHIRVHGSLPSYNLFDITLIPYKNVLSNIDNVYSYIDGTTKKMLFFYRKWDKISGNETFFFAEGTKIANNSLVPNYCNNSLDNYQLYHFYCLDTKQKEMIFDWDHFEWVESPETLKIKFALALTE